MLVANHSVIRYSVVACLAFAAPVLKGVQEVDVVLPVGYANREGEVMSSELLGWSKGRWQFLVSPAQVSSLWGRSIDELWFRVNGAHQVQRPGGSLFMEVSGGTSVSSYRGPAPHFAANRGNDHAVRFTGRLVVPDVGTAPSAPAPWTPPYAVRVPLTPPILVDPARTLVLEFATRPWASEPVPRWWIDAAITPELGQAVEFGQSCTVRDQRLLARGRPETLRPGSTTLFRLTHVEPNRASLLVLGVSDRWFHGLPLPFPLDGMGAPGCWLLVDWTVVHGTVTSLPRPRWFAGEAHVRAEIPLASALLGSEFFTQWFVVDPTANQLGLLASHGLKLRMSSAFSSFEMAVVRGWEFSSTEGEIMTHHFPILRLVAR